MQILQQVKQRSVTKATQATAVETDSSVVQQRSLTTIRTRNSDSIKNHGNLTYYVRQIKIKTLVASEPNRILTTHAQQIISTTKTQVRK